MSIRRRLMNTVLMLSCSYVRSGVRASKKVHLQKSITLVGCWFFIWNVFSIVFVFGMLDNCWHVSALYDLSRASIWRSTSLFLWDLLPFGYIFIFKGAKFVSLYPYNCNKVSILNKLILQKEMQNCVTHNVDNK